MAITYSVTTTSSSASVYLSGLDTRYYSRSFKMWLSIGGSLRVYDSYEDSSPTTSTHTCVYEDLQSDSSYQFLIEVTYFDGFGDVTMNVPSNGTGSFVTDSDTPQSDPYYTTSAGSTSITFTTYSASGYYLRYWIVLASNDSIVYDTDRDAYREYAYRDTVVFTPSVSLTPNTQYRVNVGYSDTSSGNAVQIGSSTVWTSSGGGGVVSQFDWNSSNGNATAAQTSAAYNAVTNQGSVSDFSYLVWNDICDKIMELLDAKSWEWEIGRNAPLSYSETKMSVNDKTMTAARFNSAAYQLCVSQSGLMPDITVSTGDSCLGSYFTSLVSYLNQMISQL